MTLTDLEGRDSKDQIFLADFHNYARNVRRPYMVWPRLTEFVTVIQVGWKYVSKGSATPLPQGAGAQALPNFGDYLLLIRTPFVAELPNFTYMWNLVGLLPPHICYYSNKYGEEGGLLIHFTFYLGKILPLPAKRANRRRAPTHRT